MESNSYNELYMFYAYVIIHDENNIIKTNSLYAALMIQND